MRLNQVTLPATDYAASVDFYLRLGLTQIVDAPPRYARFDAPDGQTLSIHTGEGPAVGAVVYFECDDLEAEVRRVEAAGLAFDHQPSDQPWLWREARLRDPTGNVICLYHAGENRRFPPWRIKEAAQTPGK